MTLLFPFYCGNNLIGIILHGREKEWHSLADVYDALISKRVYKPAFSHEKARAIILEGKGSHFDPDVVEAFVRLEEQFKRIAAENKDAASEELTAVT